MERRGTHPGAGHRRRPPHDDTHYTCTRQLTLTFARSRVILAFAPARSVRVARLTRASPIGLLAGLMLARLMPVVLVLAAPMLARLMLVVLVLAGLMLAALRVLAAGLARAVVLVALASVPVLRVAL